MWLLCDYNCNIFFTGTHAGPDHLPLDKVKEAIEDICSDWYSLAIQLDIKVGNISVYMCDCRLSLISSSQAIEKDHSSVEGRFEAMLRYWIKRSSPLPSWGSLIRALQSPVIDRGDIARKIETMPVRTVSTVIDTFPKAKFILAKLYD